MTHVRLIAAVILLCASAQPLAQGRAEVALRAAMEKETVDGDLRGAIEAYRRIVDGYRDERSIRAQALLRMAECYQKLGDAQATEVYKRIIREFSDQSAQVAVARSKVRQPARAVGEFTIRRLETGLDLWPDDISPDGARVAFTDWKTGNLAIRDVTGPRVMPVTSHPVPANGMFDAFGMSPVFSPDGSQLAYTWCAMLAADSCRVTLRISRVGETEPQGGRVVYTADPWIQPYDWSPDGRQLAVLHAKGDVNELAVVDVAAGSLRTLRALDPGDRPGRMAFSPDGRHLAFDAVVAAAGGDRGRREVFILPVAGGTERPVAAAPTYRTLVGWSPDGQQILFTSDNRGTVDLHSTAVVKGQPQGAAVLVKSDFGAARPLRIARTGALFYTTESGGGTRVKQVGLDFTGGPASAPAISLDDVSPGTHTSPQWSPDGQLLAYVHKRQATPQARSSVMLRASATGDTREILLDLIRVDQLRWGADGRSLYAIATNARGAAGLYRIDVRTGGTTLLTAGAALRHLRLNKAGTIAQFVRTASGRHQFVEVDLAQNTEKELFAFEAAGNPASPQVSGDGTKVFYRRALSGAVATAGPDVLVERDLASGAERELLKGRIPFVLLSPDGRHVGVRRVDPGGRWIAVSVVPTSGDPVVRDLIRIDHASGANLVAWAPDGASVIINKPGATLSDVDETWWVPLGSGAPRKLDHFMTNVHVHPDRRTVAFQAANNVPPRSDIWVMEHFLGRAGAAQRPGVR